MKIYNTLGREKQEFIPIDKNEVRLYTCGPTVYSTAHIGNLRAYIFMDTLRRVLMYNGYILKHVMNITDVGHLTSDADTGDDKMEVTAKKLNLEPLEIAKKVTETFMLDLEKLNISKPEIIANATDHIKEMEEYVEKIVENGYGYETSKGIYFDTSRLSSYGELSGVNLDEQLAGARIEVDTEKRNPLDFALWIKAKDNHIMKWESKWGKCYPGWHIECVAMGRKYLGEEFDIHTGGVDHIPIHHENEIAEARGAYSKNPAHYWMHNEFLLIDGGKMSKSLGNLYTVADLEEKGYEPLVYKLFNYTSHYRNKLNFTFDSMNAAKIALERLRENYVDHFNGSADVEDFVIEDFKTRFLDAVNDDLNMPQAMAVVYEAAKYKDRSKKIAGILKDFDRVLSIDIDKNVNKEKNINNITTSLEIESILEERKQARLAKDFKKSDELRDKLATMNIKVIDTVDGQKIESI